MKLKNVLVKSALVFSLTLGLTSSVLADDTNTENSATDNGTKETVEDVQYFDAKDLNLNNIGNIVDMLKPTENNQTRGTIINDVDTDNNNFPIENVVGKDPNTLGRTEEVLGTTVRDVTNGNGSQDKKQEESKANKSIAPHREFLSFKTKSGKVLHLIIDRDKSENNVQLVTEVSEQDLLNMIIKNNQEAAKKLQDEQAAAKKAAEEAAKNKPKEEKKVDKKSSSGGFLILLIIAGGIGAGYYFKVYKPKQNKVEDDDDEVEKKDRTKEMLGEDDDEGFDNDGDEYDEDEYDEDEYDDEEYEENSENESVVENMNVNDNYTEKEISDEELSEMDDDIEVIEEDEDVNEE